MRRICYGNGNEFMEIEDMSNISAQYQESQIVYEFIQLRSRKDDKAKEVSHGRWNHQELHLV